MIRTRFSSGADAPETAAAHGHRDSCGAAGALPASSCSAMKFNANFLLIWRNDGYGGLGRAHRVARSAPHVAERAWRSGPSRSGPRFGGRRLPPPSRMPSLRAAGRCNPLERWKPISRRAREVSCGRRLRRDRLLGCWRGGIPRLEPPDAARATRFRAGLEPRRTRVQLGLRRVSGVSGGACLLRAANRRRVDAPKSRGACASPGADARPRASVTGVTGAKEAREGRRAHSARTERERRIAISVGGVFVPPALRRAGRGVVPDR